jgi:hypothetical protein
VARSRRLSKVTPRTASGAEVPSLIGLRMLSSSFSACFFRVGFPSSWKRGIVRVLMTSFPSPSR